MKTTNKKKMTAFQYYSGNFALGCDPTTGRWDGDIFIAADGSKWTVDPSDIDHHPATDGTGTHYLIPAEIEASRN
jgi:hypothetical protein